jgi:mercuric reductase
MSKSHPSDEPAPTGFDLVVVGGGSAGFAAAIAAHEMGARVLLVNAGRLGGTCVNVGCIPSKTLIRAAQALQRARSVAFRGIAASARVEDYAALVRQKDELVARLRRSKYADVLDAYERIHLVEGRARLEPDRRVRVGDGVWSAGAIVLATGSHPWIPPVPGLREAAPLTSDAAFALTELPRSLIVLGGRYVALECAQLFARLGVRVTLLQRSPRILPGEDPDLTEALSGYLQEEGIQIETGVRTKRVQGGPGEVSVLAERDGQQRMYRAERILCATGRRPNTSGMGLEDLGLQLGEDGRILVDAHLETSRPGIYAAGDVIGEPAFVYTAAYEGRLAARNALGTAREACDETVVPRVIFTDPQLAAVGLNESEAARAGTPVEVARLGLEQVPHALAGRDTRGFVKLIKEQGGDRLLGARILAPEGGEQIMEAVLAMRFGIGVSQLAATMHPYLTQGEAIKLCAQSFERDVSKLSCCSG